MRSLQTEEIAIAGMQTREALELAVAAEAAGLAVPRYSLQRLAFDAMAQCIEVLSGTRQAPPRGCVLLASTGLQSAIEPGSPRPT